VVIPSGSMGVRRGSGEIDLPELAESDILQ
jgi:hypothetical protein